VSAAPMGARTILSSRTEVRFLRLFVAILRVGPVKAVRGLVAATPRANRFSTAGLSQAVAARSRSGAGGLGGFAAMEDLGRRELGEKHQSLDDDEDGRNEHPYGFAAGAGGDERNQRDARLIFSRTGRDFELGKRGGHTRGNGIPRATELNLFFLLHYKR
jgi:hypothetical protein